MKATIDSENHAKQDLKQEGLEDQKKQKKEAHTAVKNALGHARNIEMIHASLNLPTSPHHMLGRLVICDDEEGDEGGDSSSYEREQILKLTHEDCIPAVTPESAKQLLLESTKT